MNCKLIKFGFLFLILIMGKNSSAQISEAVVGVDGFTCSLCAKGVEGEFKALDYVQSVKTDLKKTEFTLSFKKKPDVKFSEIRDAVEDGGFSLRDIRITAKGSINTSGSSGFKLKTDNSQEIILKGITGDFENGEKVLIKGKYNNSNNSITVTTIKKL